MSERNKCGSMHDWLPLTSLPSAAITLCKFLMSPLIPILLPLLPHLLDGGTAGRPFSLAGRTTDSGLGSLVLDRGAHRARDPGQHIFE